MSRTSCRQDRRMQKFRDVARRWEGGLLSQREAAELLGCSERQFRRYRDRFEEEGEAGLIDRRLGQPSRRAIAAAEQERMLALYRARHQGWTAKHFHDWGRRHHGFTWGYTWTKSHLQLAGLLARAPRRGAHRRKRERKPLEGMMLHQDGSRHAWLAGAPTLDLIVTMDDATSTIYSAFLVEEEGTVSTLRACLEVFTAQGLPCALYTDRGSHYFYTPEAGGKVDKKTLTQVGQALDRLGVEHIAAYSPEARGRSERMFGTLQDRLVKELALTGIRHIDAANAWIRETYLPEHNRLFAQPAALPDLAFVAASSAELTERLVIEDERTVSRDNTVSWAGQRLQLPPTPERAHYVRATVKVRAYPDGSLAILHGPRVLCRIPSGIPRGPGAHTGEGAARAPAATSLAPCSGPSRPSPAGGLRPALTAPARGALSLARAETKKRAEAPQGPNQETVL
jgi:transposase